MNNGKLEGRIKLDSAVNVDFTDDGGSYTAVLPIGTYYLSSAGSTANDFLAELKAQFEAVNGSVVWTFAISAGEGGTGKVTVSNDGTACTITWDSDSQSVRDILGFTVDVSSNGQVSVNQAKGLWLPDCPPHRMANGSDSAGVPEANTISHETPSGHVYSAGGAIKYVQTIAFEGVSRARTWTASESTVNQAWETFWVHSIQGDGQYSRVGGPIRWYPDADDDATYFTYHVSGASRLGQRPVRDDWTGLWAIDTGRLVKVP